MIFTFSQDQRNAEEQKFCTEYLAFLVDLVICGVLLGFICLLNLIHVSYLTINIKGREPYFCDYKTNKNKTKQNPNSPKMQPDRIKHKQLSTLVWFGHIIWTDFTHAWHDGGPLWPLKPFIYSDKLDHQFKVTVVRQHVQQQPFVYIFTKILQLIWTTCIRCEMLVCWTSY